MSNYKVGDKVILGEHTGKRNWIYSMDKYVGKVATLNKFYRADAGYPDRWYVDLDGGGHVWHEENFNQCPCKAVKKCMTHRRRLS
jgi:hypothetical protein